MSKWDTADNDGGPVTNFAAIGIAVAAAMSWLLWTLLSCALKDTDACRGTPLGFSNVALMQGVVFGAIVLILVIWSGSSSQYALPAAAFACTFVYALRWLEKFKMWSEKELTRLWDKFAWLWPAKELTHPELTHPARLEIML